MKTQDAVQAVIGAFKSANLVALGERHWAREDSEFRLKLIRNPAFVQTVTDVVVEFANPLYQDLLDRYVNGEAVPALSRGAIFLVRCFFCVSAGIFGIPWLTGAFVTS